MRSKLALVNDLPNGTLIPVAETVDVGATESVCGTDAKLMGIDVGAETESFVEVGNERDDGVGKVETESSDVLDKGEEEADTVAAGKVNLLPGILLLVLKLNCDCTGAPVGRCTLPADLSGNIFALPSGSLNPPAFFSVCSNTVGVFVSLLCDGADSSA